MTKAHSPLTGGQARSEGPSWDDLAAADPNPLPDYLLGESYRYLGSEPISTERFVGDAFFQRELEKMWPNVWQFAAREEQLPDPGSLVVYENAGRSYVLARQTDGGIRAFHNVCLHRGRKLRTRDGFAKELRCPFHAFTWNMDGSLKQIPCAWDFPHLKPESMSLPEAQVGRWGGYVFIKENEGGPTLEEYLAPLPDHFERWEHDKRVMITWVGKVVPANWKACAEAFMESYHVIATHPQIMPFTGDANTKYSIFSDHVNLMITPLGVSSPHLADNDRGEQWRMDQFLKNNNRVAPTGTTIEVGDGLTARGAMGVHNRKRITDLTGRDHSGASDAELQDAFTYNVFPNFSPWGGFNPNIVYRWRPWPDQHHTLMEVMILQPNPEGLDVTPVTEMTLVEPEGSWADHLGQLGVILEQDMANLAPVQEGMRMSKTGELNLGDYQEVRIRHFHQTLDKYLAD
jgi:phenylpropionate dioxygenase-like ring-hydroxylating dioxygenase large terminal subunit